MRKMHINIELVPVEVAKKVLKRQQALAKRSRKAKLVVKKLAIVRRQPQTNRRKSEVLTS